MDELDAPPVNDANLQVLADMADLFGVAVEATANYRAQLQAQHFSDEAAEAMTVQFHGAMIRGFMEKILPTHPQVED